MWVRLTLIPPILSLTEAFAPAAREGHSLQLSLSDPRLVDLWATTSTLLDPSTPLLAIYPDAGARFTTTAVVASAADVTLSSSDLGQPLSSTAVIGVFIAGLVPFAVATVEFWRRIAVGDNFGTGKDSVVIIGEDNAPESSRGQRVLGQGALVTAYALFTIAAVILVVVLVSVWTSGPLPVELPSSNTNQGLS